MDYIGIIKERKVIDGKLYRRYFIDSEGKEIGIPQRVYLEERMHHSYMYVRPDKEKYPGFGTVGIPFHDKQSQERALKDSIKILEALIKDTLLTSCSSRQRRERVELPSVFNIDASELPAGVMVFVQPRNSLSLVIGVNYFDEGTGRFKKKNIYVGTPNTWKQNYANKLQEAVTLREASLKIHEKLTKIN